MSLRVENPARGGGVPPFRSETFRVEDKMREDEAIPGIEWRVELPLVKNLSPCPTDLRPYGSSMFPLSTLVERGIKGVR
jgi:hypothetical protein